MRSSRPRALALLLLAFVTFGGVAQESPAPATPGAEEEFTKAVFFGKKFAEMGDYSAAFENYAKADALRPDQPAVLYDMAVVLARAGRYSEAQVKVDRYAQMFPAGAEKALVDKLQLELGFQKELQKRRQSDQEYSDLFNRAKFLYGRAELDEALQLFQQAERLRPADAAAVFNEALIYEKQGDYARAIDRYRQYGQLESDLDAKAGLDERIYTLQHELEDMRTKIVCTFCGRKLAAGATWCERCWHGPYLVRSAAWNSRPCVEGASATRAMYFADGRFSRNDILPCLFAGGTMLEALRYSPARQADVRAARKAEGWTYDGDVLQSWTDKQGGQIRFVQGPQYLEKVTSSSGGEVLTYAAHAGGAGVWLLDREDLVIDAQRYTNRYTFDAAGRIAQQQVEYQNAAACSHTIGMTADYAYQDDAISSVTIRGGYDGFAAEGAPKVDWTTVVSYAYDAQGRLTKEEAAVTAFNKTYAQKPVGALRDDVNRLYPSMRVRKPIENVQRSGDLCATSGNQFLGNPIDLRPFYAMSPNLGLVMPFGVTRATVTFTYPDSYALPKP